MCATANLRVEWAVVFPTTRQRLTYHVRLDGGVSGGIQERPAPSLHTLKKEEFPLNWLPVSLNCPVKYLVIFSLQA